jgi:hypothetical protein
MMKRLASLESETAHRDIPGGGANGAIGTQKFNMNGLLLPDGAILMLIVDGIVYL